MRGRRAHNLCGVGELPQSVRIREVGPRDGFQNEPEVIPTAEKVRLIGMLGAAGLSRIELTSFVRPDVIPQLSDAEQVLADYEPLGGVAYSVLIPNERGLDRALELRERFQEVNLFLSASETHNRKNVNRSIAESLAGIERVVERALAEGLRCEGVISTSFGCPYEGEVPAERVLEIAGRLVAAGCEEVAFGDTTGMANPRQVGEFFAAARERLAGVELTAHFHNTRGQGLANVLAALEQGVESFESAFGELGGCPVPPGSTGNIGTEDLVSMLEEMGVGTGVDLAALIAASRSVQELLGRPLGAHVLTAGPWTGARGRLPRVSAMRSDAFRAAAEAKDFGAAEELFAEDAVFRSPVVFKPYQGREAISVLLGAVVRVFEDFRYLEQVETGDVAVLMFEARVGDRALQGVDILKFGADDRIAEMTVMVRPMSGVHALAEAMKRMLEEAGQAPAS